MRYVPTAIKAIQQEAKKFECATFWSFLISQDGESIADIPMPTAVYSSAQAALDDFMRQYSLEAPLAWLVDTKLSASAEFANCTVRIFGLYVHTSGDEK